jgi:hypothetical protein
LSVSNGREAIKTYGDHPFVSIGIEKTKTKDFKNKIPLNHGFVVITLFLYNAS